MFIKPHITEKSVNLASRGKYTFRVSPRLGKRQIKKVIEEQFKVKVRQVLTTRVPPKTRRISALSLQKTYLTAAKKAIVTLETGQKIDLFETSQKEQATV